MLRALPSLSIFAGLLHGSSLTGLVAELGPTVRAGTVQEAAAQPMVLVAVNWQKLPQALAGLPDFAGRIVHPQHWPEDLDYDGQRVVVIGSGATAVTLVPAMAERAGHVTMLQRSPSYVISLPTKDLIANTLNKVLDHDRAYRITRRKNVAIQRGIYKAARRWPKGVRRLLMADVKRRLPKGYDVDTHFNPSYDPWDQRLCLVPDGDLFKAIRKGRASVVTDHVDRFTERGIRLASGEELEADVVVTATGLNLLAIGGMTLVVDGREVDLSQTVSYKGMMLSGVPNFSLTLGYTNASWTLKADLVAHYVCRLLDHMRDKGYDVVTPVVPPEAESWNLDAGLVREYLRGAALRQRFTFLTNLLQRFNWFYNNFSNFLCISFDVKQMF